MLTTRQIELIERSWKYALYNSSETGIHFYNELLKIDPQLVKMVTSDLETQSQKLIDRVTLVVHRLRNIGEIVVDIKNLGVQFRKNGIHREHYPAVAFALLLTLDKALGEENSSEIMEAWTAGCIGLAKIMIA